MEAKRADVGTFEILNVGEDKPWYLRLESAEIKRQAAQLGFEAGRSHIWYAMTQEGWKALDSQKLSKELEESFQALKRY